ncbi:MAG: hypothetical protein R6U51_10330 [Anaerolineales bacterium]
MKGDRKYNLTGRAKENTSRAETDLQPRSALLRRLILFIGETMISLGQKLKREH